MMRNDLKIRSLMYGDIIDHLSKNKNISISEARTLVSKMSFREYTAIVEVITPPSGQTIGAPSSSSKQATKSPTPGNSSIKSIWPGQGAPVEKGMTVGAAGPNNTSVPGTVSQVDMQAKGVKIKNPTTGKEEWQNIDTLQPFAAQDQSGSPQTTTEDAAQLSRLRELAGIKEDTSSTCAANIAIAPTSPSTMRRRQPTDETQKKEYTPGSAKTIIGDTKPNQASGELSATLAANGKKTATRTHNGFKK
jgi:hypothetical protein